MPTLLITNGQVIDPSQKLNKKADVLIRDGKIEKIEENISADQADEVVDASGKVVSPGFVDIHVHLREPGREDKETIATGTRSAAKGGITTVVGMPNTSPAADNQTVIEYILSKAKKEAVVNVFASGAITKGLEGKELAEIWELKKTGAVAVSDDGFDIQNMDLYRKALQYCKTHQMPILSHTEDMCLSKGGHLHEGAVSTKLGIKGIPACGEDSATARLICLVEDVGHPLHFTHVTTKGSLEFIRLAQKKGLPITCDATPHHFSLTDEAVLGYNTHAKMNPPLRSKEHVEALHQGLKDNTIAVISTDHAPHLWTEKERDFQSAPFGIVGFETMLSLIITNLVDTGVLELSEALEKITINPAKILDLNKGTLATGADADVTIFDPKAEWTVDRSAFASKGMNSPFHGMTLKGVVTDTIVNGKIVVKDQQLVE